MPQRSFMAVRPQLSRTQVLPDNFTLYGNLAGQWANEPLLNLEQFELGGNASVRGYREGELYADTGWLGQLELRSPTYWRGTNAVKIGTQTHRVHRLRPGLSLDQTTAQTSDSLFGAPALGSIFISAIMWKATFWLPGRCKTAHIPRRAVSGFRSA